MRGDRAMGVARSARATLLLCLVVAALGLGGELTGRALLALGRVVANPDGPVYPLAVVREALRHDAAAWTGRRVWVYGIATQVLTHECPYPMPACSTARPVLRDARAAGAGLPLAWGLSDPVRAWWRRVPVVSVLVPPRQIPHWGVPARYEVTLQAETSRACPVCYVLVLRDATPVEGL